MLHFEKGVSLKLILKTYLNSFNIHLYTFNIHAILSLFYRRVLEKREQLDLMKISQS